MKRILKEISKVGVFVMILISFHYTLEDSVLSVILFLLGWLCASYYFIFMEE